MKKNIIARTVITGVVTLCLFVFASAVSGPSGPAYVDAIPAQWTCHYGNSVLTWTPATCDSTHTQSAATINWVNRTVPLNTSNCVHTASMNKTCNNPPSQPVIVFDPVSPSEDDMTSCVVSSASTDPEGDPVNYTFVWRVGGNIVLTETNIAREVSYLNPSKYDAGDIIECRVTASDDRGATSATASISVIVATGNNIAPQTPVVRINTGLATYNDSSPLSAIITGPYSTIKINGTDVFVDSDGDILSFTYQWKKGGVVHSSGLYAVSVNATDTTPGDTWQVFVRASDGALTSPWGSSQEVTITGFEGWGAGSSAPDVAYTVPNPVVTTHIRMVTERYIDYWCRWQIQCAIHYCAGDSRYLCSSCANSILGCRKFCSDSGCGEGGAAYGFNIVKNSCTGAISCDNQQLSDYPHYAERLVPQTYYMCDYIDSIVSWTRCNAHTTAPRSVHWSSREVSGPADCRHLPDFSSRSCSIPPHEPQVRITPHNVVGGAIYSPDSEDDLTCKIVGPAATYRSGYASNPGWAGAIHIFAMSWGIFGTNNLDPYYTNTWIDPDVPWTGSQSYDNVVYTFRWYQNGNPTPVQTDARGPYNNPNTVLTATSVLSHSKTRVNDIWTCEVIGQELYGVGLQSYPGSYSVTIGAPNLGQCNGRDNDGDGYFDEGMYSCYEDDFDGINFFTTPEGRKYCFDCRKIAGNTRTRLPPVKAGSRFRNIYPAALGDGEGKNGTLSIKNTFSTNTLETPGYSIADMFRNAGGQGMYAFDDCSAITADEALGRNDNQLYAGGTITCNSDRVYFTSGTRGTDTNKGKLANGNGDGTSYGVVYEATEICDGKDNDGDDQIDEDPRFNSCEANNSFTVNGINYCFSCGVTSIANARSRRFGSWTLASLTGRGAALDPAGHNTKQNLKDIENYAIPLATIYLMAPKGFYVNDSSAQVKLTYLSTTGDTSIVVGDGTLAGGSRDVAITSWTDRETGTRTGSGGLDDATVSSILYGALYSGGTFQTQCGDGVKQSPNQMHTYGITGGTPPTLGYEECDDNNTQCTNPLKPNCDMDKSDGDACVCKSTSGNTWCGDLAIQKPNSRLTGGRFNNGFEDCDSSDAGCAPNEKCAKDAFGNSLCYCERKQYYGEFQPPFSAFTEEPYTFNVQFRDDSVPATTLWDFDKLGTSGDCITALFASVSDLLMTRGVPMPVGPLNVQTRRNFYCAVTLTARAPDATYAPPGIYIVDTRTLTAICPDCNVTEIPAVLHPLGRYSTRQSDAQREFGSASVAVTTLSTRCATSCSNTARQRLEQAKTYKAAAQLYYNTCVDGDITCRISQYYSISARQVASEGMNIA